MIMRFGQSFICDLSPTAVTNCSLFTLHFCLKRFLAPAWQIDLGLRRALYNALRQHGLGDLHKAGYIGTLHVIDIVALLTVLHALAVDVRHDLM